MNEIAPVNNGNGALAVANTQRAVAEVQAAMIIARSNPRNEITAIERIKKTFSRERLAQVSTYIYSKGKTEISGPSIRAAEAIAQAWGNVQFGFKEIERGHDKGIGYSEVEAFAWDIEANTKRSLQFRVAHKRDTKSGTYPLTDEREIYEMVANQAQRRVRACIMAVIPGDVFDEAIETARATLQACIDTSPETLSKLLSAFAGKGIKKEQIEQRIQRNFESITAEQVVQLRNIWHSIKDGIGKPEDYFPPIETPEGKTENKTEALKEKIKAKREAVDQETGEIVEMTFAEVADRINKAQTADALDLAADCIRLVKEDQQDELRAMYEKAIKKFI